MKYTYSDIFSLHLTNHVQTVTNNITEYSLLYVYSGKIIIEDSNRELEISSGECVFIKQNCNISFTEIPENGTDYKGLVMSFPIHYIRTFFDDKGYRFITPYIISLPSTNVIKLPYTPDVHSLFKGMQPYFNSAEKPDNVLIDLKLQEGLYSMLNIAKAYYPPLDWQGLRMYEN